MAQVKKRRFGGDDKGAELIEFALVLPMLLLVFAAIVDFGFLFQRYEVLINAAREGARLGVLDGYVEADVDARVTSYLDASGLTGAQPTDIDVTYDTLELTPGGKVINVITVVVEYPANFFTLSPIAAMVTGGSFSTLTLRASSTMRTEVIAAGS